MVTTVTMTKNSTITKSETQGQLYQALIDLDQVRNDIIYTLTLPDGFQTFLKQAMSEPTSNKRLHYKTLAKMLFHRFGYLFFVETKMNPYKYNPSPFLYATKEADLGEIKERIGEWFEAESGRPFTYDSVEAWAWESNTISDFMDNKTSLIYRFLPSYFHDKIAQHPHMIKGFNHNQPLTFMHRLKEEGQTSCVSNLIWLDTYISPSECKNIQESIDRYPEHFVPKNKKVRLPASIQIRYQIVTKPGAANRFFLNTNISMTRYPYWDFYNDVYNGTFRLMMSSLDESMRDANEAVVDLVVKKQNGVFRLKNDYEIGLLEDLKLKGFNLEQCIRNPLNNLLEVKKYKAYPVYNNEMDGWKMFVEQGWSHLDRELIFAHFSKFTGFAPVSKLDNTSVQSNREKYPYTPGISTLSSTIEVWDGNEKGVLRGLKNSLLCWLGENDTDTCMVDHTGFEIQVPQLKNVKKPELKTTSKFKYLSLLCQSEEIAKDTLESIDKWVSGGNKRHEAYLVFYPLEGDSEFAMILKTKEQEHVFRFIHREIKGHNGLLETYLTAKKKEAPNERKRVEEVKQAALTYSTETHPVMALVNVPAYHKRGKSFLDSKGALRKGLALANRLPQFINFDETGKENHPYRSAFDDLLMKAGFLPAKLYKKKGKNPSILSEGEIWMGFKELEHRYRGKVLYFVVACKIEFGKKPYLRIVGEKNWLPMDEFNKRAASGELLEGLVAERGYKPKRDFRNLYNQLIPRIIQEEVQSSNAHHYVILDAPLRYYLEEIRNNELSVYVKPFYTHDKVSYIRYNGTEEVPELEVTKNGSPARDSGLYYYKNMEIVYSLASKSDNMQTSFKLEKKNSGEVAVSRQLPRELYVIGEPDRQRRKEIFEKVHKMRNGAITYNKESADVAPLNFIEHAKRLLPKQ